MDKARVVVKVAKIVREMEKRMRTGAKVINIIRANIVIPSGIVVIGSGQA